MSEHIEQCPEALPAHTRLLDRYETLEVLGEGGFGITYRGLCRHSGQYVAIKEFFPVSLARRYNPLEDPTVQLFSSQQKAEYIRGKERFLGEAEILKKFRHLNCIVTVLDYFEENNTAYIIMEYIEGPTLAQYIAANGPFSFPELLSLMDPVLQALNQIHGEGLIHRDISPDNLILSLDNTPHLIDFGAAGRSQSRKNPTIILKAGYAPPEQYIVGGQLGTWVDVYALCATFFFALTAKSPTEALQRMEQDEFPSPALLPELSADQLHVLQTGLALRPSERYQNVQELYLALHGLDNAIQGQRIDNAKTAHGQPLNRRQRNHLKRITQGKSFWGVRIAVGCIALGAVLSALVLLSPRPAQQRTEFIPADTSADTISTSLPTDAHTPEPADELLSMKNVTGMKLKKAMRQLQNLDRSIQIKTSYQYSSHPSDTVISQSVKTDTTFTKGQLGSISLTVSKGKKPKPTATPKPSRNLRPTPAARPEKTDSGYTAKSNKDYSTIHIN